MVRVPLFVSILVPLLAVTGFGCSDPSGEVQAVDGAGPGGLDSSSGLERDPLRKAYFGDTHVHTKYSFDAYIFGTRANPDDAYRFAKGEALMHPAGLEMKLRAPLDFLAVADHATYLGMFEEMDDPDSPVGQHALSVGLREATTPEERNLIFQEVLPRERGFVEPDDLLDLSVVRTAWEEIIGAAERHNDPGTFTAFIAYEFTAGGARGENLHRNVIFEGAEAPGLPFSRLDAKNNPERLWDWMDSQREAGIDSLAIPHNSNGSDGWMFELQDREGNPLDARYAEQRMRNEPLVEVTQVKGTSDAHPLLSPNDEWADFGTWSRPLAVACPASRRVATCAGPTSTGSNCRLRVASIRFGLA